MTHDIVCIVCPMGCRLTLVADEQADQGYSVLGNQCKRGINYAIEELSDPKRQLTTTVRITGGALNRLPVRSNHPLPKPLIQDSMAVINQVHVTAPVKMGQVIIENLLGTGVNIIASRDMQLI
jgi:CxxC motif-containing protein